MDRQYTFTLTVREGSDEFWDDIVEKNISGCEEVTDVIVAALEQHGFAFERHDGDHSCNAWLSLRKYEDLDAD